MKKFIQWLLYRIEVVYLESHGWTLGDDYLWYPPSYYYWPKKRGKPHTHGHAVTSQKTALADERFTVQLRKEGLLKDPV